MTEPTMPKPWYKQTWLWFVLSVPIASVILSSIMVYVAVVGRDSLVSDNYYKDGMGINQTIEQDRLAKEMSIHPKLFITGDGIARVEIASQTMPKQAFLTMKILHPTLKAEDVIVKLLPTESAFIADVPADLDGRRYVDLYAYDESWRIREEVTLPVDGYVMNLP